LGQLGTLLDQTGWVARIVLLMLLSFSLFSWALIFQKSRMFARMNQQTALFLRIFVQIKSFQIRNRWARAAPLWNRYTLPAIVNSKARFERVILLEK